MKAKPGKVTLATSVKYAVMGGICAGSTQKELEVSPTTLEGCKGALQAAPPGLPYTKFLE